MIRGKVTEKVQLSDDDPILDFSTSQVTMALDDQDVRLMQGRARMCPACELFSKPMCTHYEGVERIFEQHSNGHVLRSGYEALAQVCIFNYHAVAVGIWCRDVLRCYVHSNTHRSSVLQVEADARQADDCLPDASRCNPRLLLRQF